MKTVHRKTKRNMNVPKAVATALCTSILVTLILSALGSYLIWNESLPQSTLDIWVGVTKVVSMVTGSLLAMAISAEKKAIVSGISVIVYTAVLVCVNILLLDGKVENLLHGIAMATGAWLISIAIFAGKNHAKGKRRKIKIR